MEAAENLFGKVDTPRASEVVAGRIRTLIRSGKLVVGERLPPERELSVSLGVSRVTVREGLRMLEANGLISSKVGTGGGTVVTAPTSGQISEGIADMLSMSALASVDIIEARRILELGMVPLVCERATSQDVTELLALCDREDRDREAGESDPARAFDFHLRVAEATHNPAMSLLMRSFREPILISVNATQRCASSAADEHRAFVFAVMHRDAAEATAILARHLTSDDAA